MRLISIAIIAAYMCGVSSGWQCYRALNTPAYAAPSYPDWQRRDLTKEIYWLNYADKQAHAKKVH